jgi:hypothetical protein
MLRKVLVGVFLALLPSLAFGQSVDRDGCISGQPCAYGVPLPAPAQGMYQVDSDGCLVGQPCPYRGWRKATKTSERTFSDNIYLPTKHNPDGSSDVVGSNPHTGAQWDQHYEPNLGLQSGHRKGGQPWTGRLVPPFGNPANDLLGYGVDGPTSYSRQMNTIEGWKSGGGLVASRMRHRRLDSQVRNQEWLRPMNRSGQRNMRNSGRETTSSRWRSSSHGCYLESWLMPHEPPHGNDVLVMDEHERNACVREADRK